jgi:hypothetical protein
MIRSLSCHSCKCRNTTCLPVEDRRFRSTTCAQSVDKPHIQHEILLLYDRWRMAMPSAWVEPEWVEVLELWEQVAVFPSLFSSPQARCSAWTSRYHHSQWLPSFASFSEARRELGQRQRGHRCILGYRSWRLGRTVRRKPRAEVPHRSASSKPCHHPEQPFSQFRRHFPTSLRIYATDLRNANTKQ